MRKWLIIRTFLCRLFWRMRRSPARFRTPKWWNSWRSSSTTRGEIIFQRNFPIWGRSWTKIPLCILSGSFILSSLNDFHSPGRTSLRSILNSCADLISTKFMKLRRSNALKFKGNVVLSMKKHLLSNKDEQQHSIQLNNIWLFLVLSWEV